MIEMARRNVSRRDAVKAIGAAAAGLMLPTGASLSQAANESSIMATRPIPSSGEKLPVIGLGTWRVFDVGPSESERAPLEQVLHVFVERGARVIDSSPMYGRSEEVIGDLTNKLGLRDKIFFATKVWTQGKHAGIQSMERSLARFQTKRIDLMQVHNLVDVSTQLATIREWVKEGRIRYVGVTHYNSGAFDAVEKILRSEKLDFLQINYSLLEREAEQRLLPLAQERGVAVMVNRPFGGGDLFSRARSKQLPDWAADFDCRSWAQFFLKWIIAHPAVTCVIPATGNGRHMDDDLQAGAGKLPDPKVRQRMVEHVAGR